MMNQTYITDITHYLDDTGKLAEMPDPWGRPSADWSLFEDRFCVLI